MNLRRISHCAAVLATVLLTPHVQTADDLYFRSDLLSKSCTLAVRGESLAEVYSPIVSRKDLVVTGQSARVSVVFQLKDCKGPAQYEIRVMLTGTEDNEQPGLLTLDTSSGTQGMGIGVEKIDGMTMSIDNINGATFLLSNDNNNLNSNAWLQAKSGQGVTTGDFITSLTVTLEYI